jgi:hypothetical protein
MTVVSVPNEEEIGMKSVRRLAVGVGLTAALACAVVSAQQPAASSFYPAPQAGQGPLPAGFARGGLWTAGHSQSYQLAQQYAKAEKEGDKSEIRKKLNEALNQEFDQHVKQQQKALEELEKQVAHLRTVLRKRMDNKATIVERRLEQLVQEAEGMGWSGPGTPQPFSGFGGQGGGWGGFGGSGFFPQPKAAEPGKEKAK